MPGERKRSSVLRGFSWLVMEHIVFLNVVVNALGVWKGITLMRQRRHYGQIHNARRVPLSHIARTASSQELVIDMLEEKCEEQRQLIEQQRQLIIRLGSEAAGAGLQKAGHAQDGEVSSAPSRLECPVCWHSTKEVAFGCGHLTCEKCSLLVDCCPVCRTHVKHRIKLFL